MKLLEIALIAVFVQMIESNVTREQITDEEAISENLMSSDDCEEIIDLDESAEQIESEISTTQTASITKSDSLTSTESKTRNTQYNTKAPKILDPSILKPIISMHRTTAISNPEKIESLAEEINLSTLSEILPESKSNDLENSTSTTLLVTSESSTPSVASLSSNKLEDISAISYATFQTGNDMTDDSISLENAENLELQLSMSEKDGRNESQISVVDSPCLNEEESIAFCQKTLTCEKKLKWHEVMCQRQYAYPNLILEPNTKLSDISVQAEIITNAGIAGAMESVSKACMKPITSDILRQLSKLLRKVELSHKLCVHHAVTKQNLLPIRNAICEKTMIDEVQNERNDIDKSKFNNLKTRQNAFDYCAAIVAPMKEQCAKLKQCCPSYVRCTELMTETNISKKYKEILKRTKQIQNDCEKKIMATLQSLHSAFTLFS
ncbi:hypothetical protein ACH3XW_20950 [Acanthocheilonema viteae]